MARVVHILRAIMFDEPEEQPDRSTEKASDAATQAKEKAEELRAHAELAAVYEGPRKFGSAVVAGLDADVARDVQRGVAKLEKVRVHNQVVPPEQMDEAVRLLTLGDAKGLGVGDYHVHRRPGEVMVVRWLDDAGVETWYQRLQAHFDAALEGVREDERQEAGWKGDARRRAYLDALDEIKVDLGERYARKFVRDLGLSLLTTQTADEINIAYLCDHLMGIPAADLVGKASAPPEGEDGEEPSEKDLAWFFKLFLLRGRVVANKPEERACFFTFLQKTDDSFDF